MCRNAPGNKIENGLIWSVGFFNFPVTSNVKAKMPLPLSGLKIHPSPGIFPGSLLIANKGATVPRK